MSVYAYLGNQADIEWLTARLASFMGMDELLQNPTGVPDFVSLIAADGMSQIELRRAPDTTHFARLDEQPLVAAYVRTDDEAGDVAHLVDLLREAKQNDPSQ